MSHLVWAALSVAESRRKLICAPIFDAGNGKRNNYMGKYLLRGNYVGDGIAGLMKDGGSKRLAAAQAALGSFGGSMDCFYYAFGDTDVFGVVDFPDDASATAASLLVNASGAVSLNLTPLLTVEDLDAAAQMSGTYTPPGT
jgi:uncharacterized protein with GYD domain